MHPMLERVVRARVLDFERTFAHLSAYQKHVKQRIVYIVYSLIPAEATINSVSRRHFPSILVNSRLPSNVEEELVALAMEQVEETFPEMWEKIVDLLCDQERGLDNDGMIISVFTRNKVGWLTKMI